MSACPECRGLIAHAAGCSVLAFFERRDAERATIIPRAYPDSVPFGCGLCDWTRAPFTKAGEMTNATKQVKQCDNCRAAALREHAAADRRVK